MRSPTGVLGIAGWRGAGPCWAVRGIDSARWSREWEELDGQAGCGAGAPPCWVVGRWVGRSEVFEEGGGVFGGGFGDVGEDGGVDVAGEAGGGVSEGSGDDFDVDAGGEHEGGGAVVVVEADGWEAGW